MKTPAQILAAAQTLAALAHDVSGGGNADGKLRELRSVFETARETYTRNYAAIVNITVTDAAQADLAALWVVKTTVTDGVSFRVSATGDTTDDALETAKGSAVVAGDVFTRVGATAVFVAIAAEVTTTVVGLDAALAS